MEAITFDFWHTLFREVPGAFRLYKARRRSLLTEMVLSCREVDPQELERACKVEAESHDKVWRDEHRTLAAVERVGRILNDLCVSLPDTAIVELATHFEEGILEQPPLLVDGACEVLDQLRGHYRLGIISDVGFSPGRVLKQVLSNHGLLNHFDSLTFSDEAGRAKPHVEVFEHSAKLLSVEPSAIVHVGDLERTDIVGAKQAGYHAIRFVGVTPMEDDETSIADFVTDDLTDIPRLVGMLG
jgi:HAD superfamily hydrolase (TIGR01549 family)